MARAKVEFTQISSLRSEAIGEPGQRTFRVLVDSASSSAIMWLEKEQLFQLALAVRQLIATPDAEQESSNPTPPDNEAPALTKLDFHISALVLGRESSSGLFIIDAHDVEEQDEETASVRLWVNQDQVGEFAEEAIKICAAGRPLCPLCGKAIDPTGHACARTNGHVKATDF